MKAVRLLLAKELTDSLRDRRTLVLMLLVPVLLYPALTVFVGFVVVAGRERLAREPLKVAVTTNDARELLGEPPSHTTWVAMDRPSAEAAMRKKEVAAIVEAPEGSVAAVRDGRQAKVTVLYTKRHDTSKEALDRLERVLEERSTALVRKRLLDASLPETFATPIDTEPVDVDFQKNLGPFIASQMLPAILLAMLFLGTLYPAIDATAGEKERGTLETLLSAPVLPTEVMTAKFLAVSLIGIAVTLMNLSAMTLSFGFAFSLGPAMEVSLSLSAGQVLTLMACLLPAALMSAGLSLAVASLAKSFKDAQNLLSPVMLAATMPGVLAVMPGIELNAVTALVPLLNIALLVKATILGAAQPLHVFMTVATVAVCASGAIAFAAKAFQSERLRFGGAESWRDLSPAPRVKTVKSGSIV